LSTFGISVASPTRAIVDVNSRLFRGPGDRSRQRLPPRHVVTRTPRRFAWSLPREGWPVENVDKFSDQAGGRASSPQPR
jgi:hypothetical protein